MGGAGDVEAVLFGIFGFGGFLMVFFCLFFFVWCFGSLFGVFGMELFWMLFLFRFFECVLGFIFGCIF